jgi:hypothetical protein
MPIYKGKEISMDEWYKINPAVKPKPPMTPEEANAKRKREYQNSLIDSVSEFGDALDIGDYIYAANDKHEGIKTGLAAREVVEAYRMLAQLVFKRNGIPEDTWYEGCADDMHDDDDCAGIQLPEGEKNDDPNIC